MRAQRFPAFVTPEHWTCPELEDTLELARLCLGFEGVPGVEGFDGVPCGLEGVVCGFDGVSDTTDAGAGMAEAE